MSFKTSCPSRIIWDRQDKKWKEGFQRHPDLLLPSSAEGQHPLSHLWGSEELPFPKVTLFLPFDHHLGSTLGSFTREAAAGGGAWPWGWESPSFCCQEQATHPQQVEEKQGKFFWTGSSPSVSATVSPRLSPASSQRRWSGSRLTSPALLTCRGKENLSVPPNGKQSQKVVAPSFLHSAITGWKAAERKAYILCRASFPWSCTQAEAYTLDIC